VFTIIFITYPTALQR